MDQVQGSSIAASQKQQETGPEANLQCTYKESIQRERLLTVSLESFLEMGLEAGLETGTSTE